MAFRVTFIFICAGLTGIQSISTVGHVAVEVGGTVHIPCKYEAKYSKNIKYLCWGYYWNSCKTKIRSDEKNSSKYSINDDKNQRIVTFTVKNLVFGDSDNYWCTVEISSAADDGTHFQLSVTKKGESQLYVDSQWITAHFDQVNIYCKFRGSGSKQWCRVGGPCVSTSGRIDGAPVTTNTSVPGVFAVTMTGLTAQNIGWYWCRSGDLQMPVFLNLTERPTPTTIATTSSATTEPTPGKKSVSDYIIAAAIAVGSLIFIVVVSVVIWFMLKRNVKNTEGPQSEKDQDVVYSDIIIRSQPSSNRKRDEPLEVSVIRSTIKTQGISRQTTGPAEGSVIYSTVSKL